MDALEYKNFNAVTASSVNTYKDGGALFLKRAIWVYFFLLIFEGALRKWILPSLASPLLIVRDPIALIIVLSSWRRGFIPSTPYLIITTFIGTICIFTALFLGHGNLPVALFGARILLIHFPLVFVIGRIFNHDDVVAMGKATLYISIPMTVLVFLQFYSPQSAWVNRGVGGSLEGAGFTGTGTFSRPPGTFSFTNGNTLFYSFAAPFIIFFSLNSTKINRIILIASIVAMIFAIPLSISRALFFQVIISLFFMLLAVGRKPKNLGSILIFLLLIVIAAMGLSRFGAFQTATEAFTDRFESANEAEGGLNSVFLDRYLGGMLEAIKSSSELPFFGGGLGMGTNVGSSLLTGSSTFLLSEGEWGRLIGEMGPIMGMLIIVIRVLLTIKLSILGYKKVASGNHLPWLLLSFGLFIIPQGQWGQPTSLGFSTLVGGLIIASFRISK